MGSDILLTSIPLNFTPAARQLYEAWGLTPTDAARPVLTARARTFQASTVFGPYPSTSTYSDSWIGQDITFGDTPTDRVNEITDALYRARLALAIGVVLDRPGDVALVHDHLSDRYWLATGGPIISDEPPTPSTTEVEIIADSGICDQPITPEDLAVTFPDLETPEAQTTPPTITPDHETSPLEEFVASIAQQPLDGEEDHVWENDDTWTAIHEIIANARTLTTNYTSPDPTADIMGCP